MTDLSIVVVTWNTRALVLDCLASIEGHVRRGDRGLAVETIVVDNGSSDGSGAAIRARFPWARVVTSRANRGFAAGANAGLREIRGRHALLLNSDARLLEGACEACVAYLDAHPDVGAVGPQLLHPDGSLQNSIHNFPTIPTEIVPKRVFQLLLPARHPSRHSVGHAPITVEAVAGAALFLRAELLRRVGPLSEQYFFFLEETDWCRRVGAAGWRVVFLPQARVVHVSGASSKRKDATLTRIEYHRSLYRFYRTHRGAAAMWTVVTLRLAKSLFYVASQAPLALLGGRLRARWRGHLGVLRWHLAGCPATVGVGLLAAGPAAPSPAAGAECAPPASSADAKA